MTTEVLGKLTFTDTPDVNGQNVLLDAGTTPSIASGTLGARPAASVPGRLYVDTTTPALFRDTGVAWQQIAAGVTVAGTAGQITVTPSGGLYTISLPTDVTVAGSFNAGTWVQTSNYVADTQPPSPVDGNMRWFSRSVGGRSMPSIVGSSGVVTALQPHFARNAIAKWEPAGNSTTISATGGAALTATGTATAANVATTNLHTYMKRLDYLTTAATTAVAGFRLAAAQYSIGGNAAIRGGFHYICRWGPATGVATATNRAFVGMANTTAAPTDVQPSTITNIAGMGWDSADTNIQFMYRGTGTVTKIDLGANFPVPTADRTKVYELAMFSRPGLTQQLEYEVTDLDTGVKATGTITTNLPTTTTLLAPRGWMSVGGTFSVIGISLMCLYLESDY